MYTVWYNDELDILMLSCWLYIFEQDQHVFRFGGTDEVFL